MVEPQEDVGGEAYPGGDAYSEQAMIELPSKELQCLVASIRLLIPGGNTLVDVTQMPAGPDFQAVLE